MTTTVAPSQAGPLARPRGASLTGTLALTKLALRRDRIMLPVWIYLILAGVSANAYTFGRLYNTPSSRAALVASAQSNPALLFLYGRLNGDSVGALTAWRFGVWGALIAVLMTIFIVLLVLWVLGLVTSYTLYGYIHLLLVIALVVLLIRLIQGRRVL